MDELLEKVSQFHFDKKITVNGNSHTQALKLYEETGELAAGILKHDKKKILDSIGDSIVVLQAIATLEGFTLKEALEYSYEEIKDRKGYLDKHGNFIKESDIKDGVIHV